MAVAQKIKPERSYPNMNALHAVRGVWSVSDPAKSLPLTRGQWYAIGTLPANSMIMAAEIGVHEAATPAATLELAVTTDKPPGTVLQAAQTLAAPGVFLSPKTSLGLGSKPNRSIIYARISSGAVLTAGGFHAIVTYYSQQD